VGPAIAGSPDVKCNQRPALRVGDPGIHMACCGTNTWEAKTGASTVFINGKAAYRMADASKHCGTMGKLIEGSPNVIVEDGDGGGGGAGAAGGGAGAGGGGSGGGGGGAAGGDMSSADYPAPDNGSDNTSSNGNGNGNGNGDDNTATPAPVDDTPANPDEIRVTVLDAVGKPLKDVYYELDLPDGSTKSGVSDETGLIHLTGLTQKGDCTLRFPDVDRGGTA